MRWIWFTMWLLHSWNCHGIIANSLADSENHENKLTATEALVGNLCRCTGYEAIIDSADAAKIRIPENLLTNTSCCNRKTTQRRDKVTFWITRT